jgi:carboxypeptidase D
MYAGLMPIAWDSNTEGDLFFWLARNRNSVEGKKQKLLVWLNGGPGCSSMVGMMLEHGPFTIEAALAHSSPDANGNSRGSGAPTGLKYNLKYNPYSWNEVADVLYVEQPIRTGYTVPAKGAGPIVGEQQIAEDFRGFLLSFMRVFTEFTGLLSKRVSKCGFYADARIADNTCTDVEFYIAGESYAGFYVPWIAEHIIQQQLVTNADGTTRRDRSGEWFLCTVVCMLLSLLL